MSTKRKRQESLQGMAEEAVRLWYSVRVDYGLARYAPVAEPSSNHIPSEVLRDPDPLAQAKSERPWNWSKTVTRTVEGPDGKPMTDARGRVVIESIPILDVLSADGRETRPGLRSAVPYGQGSELPFTPIRKPDWTSIANAERAHEHLLFINRTMMRVALIEPISHHAVELWAAGYTRRQMGEILGIGTGAAQLYYEIGIRLVMFAVNTVPDYERTDRRLRPVRMACASDVM